MLLWDASRAVVSMHNALAAKLPGKWLMVGDVIAVRKEHPL